MNDTSRRRHFPAATLGLVFFAACVFPTRSSGAATEPSVVDSTLQPIEQGADFQVWQRIQTLRDAGGNTLLVTNPAFVELQTGLHYREDGVWKESREIIEAVPGGAVARYGGHKVIFAESSGSPVVIDLETPDGKRLQSRVLGLSYLDSASGKSVLLANVQSAIGQIMNTNQVIYADAFSGVKADVRYTYTKAGLEQDVILRERPATPESFGLDAKTTRLQVITEFLSPPEPVIETKTLGGAADRFEDQTLDFGVMQMVAGKAFLLGDSPVTETPVSKRWSVVDGRTVLTEEVALAQIAKQLESLPARKRTAFFWKKSNRQLAAARLNLPARKTTKPAKRAMQMAQAMPQTQPGLVLDYVLLSSQANFTFKGDTTYYVSGVVNLSGTTTIEGGAVLKYTNLNTARIILNGPVSCQTAPYRPGIFTAKDDNSVGEIISGSTGNPNGSYYGNCALQFAGGSGPNASVANIRVRHLRTAIRSTISTPANSTLSVTNCQLVNCQYGISLNYNNRINLRNALFANVTTGIEDTSYYNYSFVDAQQVTFDQVTYLASRYSSPGMILNMNLTNCVVASVSQLSAPGLGNVAWYGDYNGFYPSTGPVFGLNPLTIDWDPFYPPIGGGAHYLAEISFRSVGLTSIDPALLASLKTRTTQPPLVYDGTSAFLSPRGLGDLGTPDLGYHYDVLDYVGSGININGTLTLVNGVAVGFYGAYGFQNGTLASAGTALNHSHLGLYSAVQEQAGSSWGNASGSYFMNPAAATALNWQFTDLSLAGGALFGGGTLSPIAMTDCSLLSVKVNLSIGEYFTHSFTNNVMDRCYFQYGSIASAGYPVNFWNNLIRNSSLSFGFYGNGSFLGFVTIANNLFVNDSFLYAIYPNYAPLIANNGYNNTTATSQGTLPKTINSLDFQPGPRGPYYYPISGGNLSQLLDAGSGTPADLGLDSYTTWLDQTLDADPVDIGFHYIPIDAPVAFSGSAQTCRNTPVNITLGGFDPNGLDLPLTYTVVANPNPVHGQLTGTGPSRTYTTYSASYEGPDSFTYVVNNGYLSSFSAATVTIQVGGEPFALSQNAMVGQWTAAHPLSATIPLIGTDDCNDPLTYRITRPPTHGTATVVGNTANCTYTPTPNVTYVGPDDFEFVANDGNFDSGPATVSINIAPGPDLSAECGYTRIFLSWDITAIELLFGGGYASGFKIYRGDSSGGPYTLITPTKLAGDVRSFEDASAILGQNYFYIVTFVREEPGFPNPTPVITYESQYSNEVPMQTCPVPPGGSTDVAFIVDNTASIGDEPLTKLRNDIEKVLDVIDASSGGNGNYRLALVTPDDDRVNVRVSFPISGNNRNAFITALNADLNTPGGGNNPPESTDECLNTVVNNLLENGREDPRLCYTTDLQTGDFLPPGFGDTPRKLVVMITDHEPGGFCDVGDSGARAAIYAGQARSKCIRINAIQVGNNSDATSIMINYKEATCGWYEQTPTDGTGIAEAVARMLFVSGFCNCP